MANFVSAFKITNSSENAFILSFPSSRYIFVPTSRKMYSIMLCTDALYTYIWTKSFFVHDWQVQLFQNVSLCTCYQHASSIWDDFASWCQQVSAYSLKFWHAEILVFVKPFINKHHCFSLARRWPLFISTPIIHTIQHWLMNNLIYFRKFMMIAFLSF